MRTPSPSDPYPFAGAQLPCLIGGEFTRAGRSFDNINPVNGRRLCGVTEADAASV